MNATSPQPSPSDKPLRLGVIGAGNRGVLAQLAHQPEKGARLVAAADVHQPFLDALREKCGTEFLTRDYRELAARDDLDAVFVCSPDPLHEEHAVAVLETGKAVYLEKPMAITVEGCDRILRTACEHKTRLYLGHNMRHMVFVLKMKEIIDQGLIGEVKAAWCRHFVGWGGDFYFKDWHADRRNTTSLLLQKGAHDIDVLHWLCGGFTRRVSAMGGLTVYGAITDRDAAPVPGKRDWSLNHWPPLSLKGLNSIVDVEDISMVHMQLDNGVFCSYQQCHYTPDYWRNYTVIGTEGRIENFGDGHPETVIRLWDNRSGYHPAGHRQFPAPAPEGSHGGADLRIVDEFLRYVRGDSPATTSPVAARHAVAVGCLAADSLRHGSTPRDVPPLTAPIARYFQ